MRGRLNPLFLAGVLVVAVLVFGRLREYSDPEPAGEIRPASVTASGGWTEIRYKDVPAYFVPPLPNLATTPPPISIEIETEVDGALLRVSALYLRPGIPADTFVTDFEGKERNLVFEDYSALRDAVVIQCLYKERGGARPYTYWHGSVPVTAYRARLRARSGKHPLLLVGPQRLNCPATLSEAGKSDRS